MATSGQLSYIQKEIFDSITTYNPVFLKAILNLIEERKNGKFLDIGCNDGSITQKISIKAKVNESYGVDIAEKMLNVARSKGIKTILHDLNEEKKFPFPENYFDIVTCFEVIEHTLATDFLLDEIYRVLKPSRYAIISTPRLDSLYIIGLLSFGFQPDWLISVSKKKNYGGLWKDKQYHHSGHVSLFTKKAFKEMLIDHSFKIIKYAPTNIFIQMIPFRKDTQIWKIKKINKRHR